MFSSLSYISTDKKLGTAPEIIRLVYSGLSTRFFSLIRNHYIWILGERCLRGMEIESFSWYVGAIEWDFKSVWTCTPGVIPFLLVLLFQGSKLPIFKSKFAVFAYLDVYTCDTPRYVLLLCSGSILPIFKSWFALAHEILGLSACNSLFKSPSS